MNVKKKLLEWGTTLLIGFVVALLMFFLCWPVRVEGGSMENNYHSGDRLFISRVLNMFSGIERGDTVAVNAKKHGESRILLKRVIALPGESLLITGGIVYINGEPLDENYLKDGVTPGEISSVMGDNEYFVMGDNRLWSTDSREYGAFDKSELIGKVIFRWYPFDNMGITVNPYK